MSFYCTTAEGIHYTVQCARMLEIPVPHAVLQDGESTRLADDQIGPLHEHDRHEVRGLEGELELLSLVERLEQKF